MERKETEITRFIEAQIMSHKVVKRELINDKKETHWMWYTFPQVDGLGYTDISKYYAIHNKRELCEYVSNQYLRDNLMELFTILLNSQEKDIEKIFGDIDAVKFRSCLTLFRHTKKFNKITTKLLRKYFDGKLDIQTEIIYKEM